MIDGVSVVVPTLGRSSLTALLEALATELAGAPFGVEVIVVDDRPPARRGRPLPLPTAPFPQVLKVVTGAAAGPAAARNAGWRLAAYPWVAFLDDDVEPAEGWLRRLAADLDVDADVVGVQGVVEVPLPAGRRPGDWERVTAGLATAKWITADMAYRRSALAAARGFDERFPRAFREDAELAYRLRAAGGRLVVGTRRVIHPVRRESPWVSVRTQRGNADDALLRRMYGPDWRRLLEVPRGRRRRHATVTGLGLAAGAAGVGLLAARRSAGRWLAGRRLAGAVAIGAGVGWLAGTAEFAVARIAPGPRTPGEVARMVATSVVIPPVATAWWLVGWWRHRHVRA